MRNIEASLPEIAEKENESKSRGKNVSIDAYFIRHGEKEFSVNSPETGLTNDGRVMAADFGKNLRKKDAIKPFSSDTERTIETVSRAIQASPTEKKMTLRIKDELALKYDMHSDFTKKLFENKRAILGNNFDTLPEEEKKRRLDKYYEFGHDFYLSYGDQRPDPKTEAPVETAAKVARRADIYMRMADRLRTDSTVDLLNGSHDYVIAAFLKEVMVREVNGNKVRGFSKISEIGGPINYTEGFNLRITTNEQGKKKSILIFRGKEYGIDQKRLAELVEIAKKLEAKEKDESK